jgi:hypothetical protein
MTIEHTPGEWKYSESGIDGRFYIYQKGIPHMTLAHGVSRADYGDAAFANAQLIAAAPELLTALQIAVGSQMLEKDVLAAACDALRKAGCSIQWRDNHKLWKTHTKKETNTEVSNANFS